MKMHQCALYAGYTNHRFKNKKRMTIGKLIIYKLSLVTALIILIVGVGQIKI